MTGTKKQEANRRNASKSRGPRTPAGKWRAARNAVQHGLSVASLADPSWAPEVRELADLLAHQEAPPKIRELAYLVAAAQIDIVRVSKARYELLGNTLGDDGFETTWQRNKREMIIKHKSELPPDSYQRVMTELARKPKGEEKVALVFSELSEQLLRLERYERRARSRRRKAIRAFDLATRKRRSASARCLA
jgi:hypothetical protein